MGLADWLSYNPQDDATSLGPTVTQANAAVAAAAPPPPAPPPAPTPQGIGYVAGQQAQAQNDVPAAPPMGGLSRDDALAIGAWTPNGGKPVGARWQPSTRGETLEGRQASPEYQQAIGDKLQADQGQLVAQANYDATAGGAQNEAARRLAVVDEQQARDAAMRAADQASRLAADRQHIQDLMVKSAKPDQSATGEYWGSKSAWGTVATGLSMALKGFVFSGYGRGQDPGQWLNQQISQVVQEQQNRAAKNREAVGDASTLYGQNKQALGDDERSKLATELALRNQVSATLARRVAEATADPAAQLRGAQLQKALADQNAATLEQFWDKTADKHTSQESDSYKPAVSGGGKRDPLEVLRRSAEARKLGVPVLNDTDVAGAQLEQQKGALGLRKDVADVGKSEAEAQALKDKAGGGTEALTGQSVPSTAYQPQRMFQGTDAHDATIDQAAYNATMTGLAIKKWGGRAGRDVAKDLAIESGDTPGTIAKKREKAAQLFGAKGAGSIPGFTPGVEDDPE